ncbi:MAG: UDP-N-acetylglucosamine 1-carboxyvinyltransferase, partial [Clostridiales bacterium]|nr:UDP-N-acetylglucosamine 1-carboxyvinyltransferase [Clostridiales bacterium]
MRVLRVRGGRPLSGSVAVHGAKNSVLPILAASILAGGVCVIHNCPSLNYVDAAVAI